MENENKHLGWSAKWAIIIGLLFIISIILERIIGADNFEIMNGIISNLLTFTLPFWLITAFLILLLIWNINRENKKSTGGFSSFLLLLLCLGAGFISFFFTIFTPPEMKDVITYQSENNPKNKIICQFYLTGITSSAPNWRIIQTNNEDGLIRKIKIIEDPENIGKLELSNYPTRLPKINEISIDRVTYKLKKYKLQNNQGNWIQYRIRE
ncbi:MAG: hypothetical protein EPN39_04840 [Chitinophagaceae bacterium]|nr:MAG: hypothetical protein EPN39_04840 [Chitinophagaceae bacterium]